MGILKDRVGIYYRWEQHLYTRLGKVMLALNTILLAARVFWGYGFMDKGYGKLSDLTQTASFFEGLDLFWPFYLAVTVGIFECAGGFLLALGAVARVVAIPLTTILIVAYRIGHPGEAFTAAEPFPYLMTTLSVLLLGAGQWSLDGLIARKVNKAEASED